MKPIKTYHVRCFRFDCLYIHHGLCYNGIITLDEDGKCLCYTKQGEENEVPSI